MEQHPLEPQWEWLKKLPCGSHVIRGDGTQWLKVDMGAVLHYRGENDYWANLESGVIIYFSFLADQENPPREYSKPSPFS